MQVNNKSRRKKLKINTCGKLYTLKDSPLYNITTRAKLSTILCSEAKLLNQLKSDENYQIFSIEKPSGGERVIETPKYGLDVVHTRIASLLTRISVPDYLHSGIKKRSNITNAEAHIGVHPILTMDIKKFYPSVTKKSVFYLFTEMFNMSRDVAGLLAEICTYENHIPTGSRISMPLSFWANFQMYERLNSLCLSRNVKMTVYVDDLTFSGLNVNELFQKNVTQIINASGLVIHPDKTRLYEREAKKLITGVIVGAADIKVRNRHHQLIYELFNKREIATDENHLAKINSQLLGRLVAAGQIETIFKQRAISLRDN